MSVELDVEAGEYVIGTLDGAERQAFAMRLAEDPAARAAVLAWEARLSGLADSVASMTPPATVWAGIERALGWMRADPVSLKVIQGGGKLAVDPAPRLRKSLARWRAAAVVASGIAAALLVFVAIREIGGAARDGGTSFVAAINRGGDKPALIVRVDLRTRTVHVRPVAVEAPAGKSLELWYINDGKPPRSMGVVDKTPIEMPIPRGVHADAATIAVSVEPRGGSTTGNPTGPVVYSGELLQE